MIYHLSPAVLRKIWGGKHLEQLKKIPNGSGDPVGETWEISIHPEGRCFHRQEIFKIDETKEELPYLVKLIDTDQELSVQVHPPDDYARMHENSSGKSECWLILNAHKNAGVYLGLKDSVTEEMFTQGIRNKNKMSDYLNFYPVSPGDFFYVPAGSVHAIGGGVTLAEVQQNSGITYRVWDWDRLDSQGVPRQLHVDKSLAVINFSPAANTADYFKRANNLFNENGKWDLIAHPAFKMSLINLSKNQSLEIPLPNQKRLVSLLNLAGKIMINGESVDDYCAAIFRNEKNLLVQGIEEGSFLIIQ